jgi:hypothetical protein
MQFAKLVPVKDKIRQGVGQCRVKFTQSVRLQGCAVVKKRGMPAPAIVEKPRRAVFCVQAG